MDIRELALETKLQCLKQQMCRTEGTWVSSPWLGKTKEVGRGWQGRGPGNGGKKVERPQPGAGSRTHSELSGACVLGLTGPPGPGRSRAAA